MTRARLRTLSLDPPSSRGLEFDKGAAVEIQLSFKGLENQLQFISRELASVSGVQRIDIAPVPPPRPGTKSAGSAVSDVIVRLLPDAIDTLLVAIGKTVKRLTSSPTKIGLTVDGQTITLEFDPRFETSTQMAKAANEIVKRLRTTQSNGTA